MKLYIKMCEQWYPRDMKKIVGKIILKGFVSNIMDD